MNIARAKFSFRNRVLGLWVCAVFFLLMGCSKSAAPLNSADVLFVNGCADAGFVSVKANSISVSGATGIGYLANSGYKYVTAGTGVNLTFFEDNGVTPLANQAENMVAAVHYSAFVGGVASNPIYIFTTDDLTPPAAGNAKVRFVNLSPDNINESVTANDTLIAQGIGVNTASSFYEIAAGYYVIGAFDPGNKNMVINGDSLVLAKGKIYTVMLSGSQTGTGITMAPALTFINNN